MSPQNSGSWFAAASEVSTNVPFGICLPRRARSAVATRRLICTGDTHRRSSSIADAGIPSSRMIASCSGCLSNSYRPVPMRLTVVSCPATKRSSTWSRSSFFDMRSPPSSASIMAVRRSSAGFPVFHSMTSSMRAFIFSAELRAARISSSVKTGSRVLTRSPDQALIDSLSDSGMPSISAMTSKGSGNASRSTTSA